MYRYLALGDSYTIGEAVQPEQSFPNQTVEMLSTAGLSVTPTIIAKTGWTTGDLLNGINERLPQWEPYDVVSLLIGVNNQYRGGDAAVYAKEFETLLSQAIHFAHEKPLRVFVLSIPDWGVTPYAFGRDCAMIAREIDAFNEINKRIAERYEVNYLDITAGTREAGTDNSLLASDGLHPSEIEYERWSKLLALAIRNQLT